LDYSIIIIKISSILVLFYEVYLSYDQGLDPVKPFDPAKCDFLVTR